MSRPQLPAPTFWTLEALASPQGWNTHRDFILALAEDGKLALSVATLDGEERLGVTDAERLRVEHGDESAPLVELRADAKRSRAEALALAWAYAWGDDPAATSADARAAELMRWAETQRKAGASIRLSRDVRTYAAIYQEAITLLIDWKKLEPTATRRGPKPEAITEPRSAAA